MAKIRVQGSRWFAFDPVAKTVTRLQCLKTFDSGSDSSGKIETTCLDEDESKSYLPGLSDPGEGSLGFDFDPEKPSHLQIIGWAQAKKELTIIWAEPKNDTDIPTVDNGALKLPTNRTFWQFDASLTAPVWKSEADALVNCTVTMQRKTSVKLIPATSA